MKDKYIMKFQKQAMIFTLIGILILPILGQSSQSGNPEEDATLITIHAEDAPLSSILAMFLPIHL